jgi:secreted trypsin-like serine protease
MRPHLAAFSLFAVSLFAVSAPAFAVTGHAPPATGWAARPIVMLIDARGDLCTGTALARDLVLNAAHCVTLPIHYHVRVYQNDAAIAVRSITRHPRFNMASYAASRATADVALLKLAAPLPDIIVPAGLAAVRRVAVGETLTIAGFGVTRARTADGLGIPRMATLTVTGKPGSLQVRLTDPAAQNQRGGQKPGLGGCVGDSGAPAFDGAGPLVIGVVSCSSSPNFDDVCGGLTGITPLLNYHRWIVDTAKKLGSPVTP